jgi:hypothetical protein
MKYLLSILCLIGFAQMGLAQQRHRHRDSLHTTVPFRHSKWAFEAGVNTTPMLYKVLKKSPDSSNANPYLFWLRYSRGPWGVHTSFNGEYDYAYNNIEGFADSKTQRKQALYLRTGIDYRLRLGKPLTAQVGLDYVRQYRYNTTITDSGFDVIQEIDQYSLNGVGATAGLTYWVTKRIGLMTEMNVQWLVGYKDTARRFKNFPELDDRLESAQVNTVQKSVLGGLFLVVKI